MHEEPTSSRGSSPERDEDLAQVLLRNVDNVATRNSEQSLSQIGDVNINMHVNPFCLASSSTISRGPSSGDIGRGETRAAGGEPVFDVLNSSDSQIVLHSSSAVDNIPQPNSDNSRVEKC